MKSCVECCVLEFCCCWPKYATIYSAVRLNVYIEFVVRLFRFVCMCVSFLHSSVFVNGDRGEFTYDTPRASMSLYVCVCVCAYATSCLVLLCAQDLSTIFSKLYYSFSASVKLWVFCFSFFLKGFLMLQFHAWQLC